MIEILCDKPNDPLIIINRNMTLAVPTKIHSIILLDCWCCSVAKSCLCYPVDVEPTGLLCLWDFPGKNTGQGYQTLLQGIFPTQGLNPCLLSLLHWQEDSLPLVSYAYLTYLRSLIFLMAILIPACDLSSLAFFMMYSAQMLNKQCDNIQHYCTPFPILNQLVVPCKVPYVGMYVCIHSLFR